LAFLDGTQHGNNAIADTETELFVLSAEQFNAIAEEHKRLAYTLINSIARTLSYRLRHAEREISLLHE
jgi:SulP family sulfate permease